MDTAGHIQRAIDWMEENLRAEITLEDAALEYGFDSASGFTRAFKREFGCSPREYAKASHPLPPAKVILKEMKHIMIPQKLIARALQA